jgi:hypothetical protein
MTKVLFGRLRRDTMILLVDAQGELDMEKEAEKAVREGRAQEAFVVEASSYFTASDINWDPEGTNARSAPASVPPLNPGAGEQETTDQSSAVPATTLQQEREAVAKDSPSGPDTGHNPDLTPTGKARTDKELQAGKESGGVPQSPSSEGKASPAKTSAFDSEVAAAKDKK